MLYCIEGKYQTEEEEKEEKEEKEGMVLHIGKQAIGRLRAVPIMPLRCMKTHTSSKKCHKREHEKF